jgi:hypothetical protein
VLSRSPDTLAFGSQEVDGGPTTVQQATIANAGTEPVAISGVALGGDADQFIRLSGQASDCDASTVLSAGQSCKVRVAFDPAGTGAKSATVTVSSNAPDVAVALTGTGTRTVLSRNPASLDFGAQDVDSGAGTPQVSTVQNSGEQPVTIGAVSLSGADAGQFQRLTDAGTDCKAGTQLAAGETCTVRVRFDPTATGAASATVTVSSNAPDVTIGLTGSGTKTALSRSPTVLQFGSRDIDDGPTATQSATFSNTGTEPVTVSGVTGAGTAPDQYERMTGDPADCAAGRLLAPGDGCTVRVRFDPSSTGSKTATMIVASNAPSISITLIGTGIQTELTPGPAALDFGSRDVGGDPSAPLASGVTNTGSQAVTLTGVTLGGADAGQFARLADGGGDCAAGTVLAAGQACTVRARFAPTATGDKAAAVTVASNAADVHVGLTGAGTQPSASAASASSNAGGSGSSGMAPGLAPTGGGTVPLLPPALSVGSSRLTLGRGGRVPLRLTCAAAQACAGTVDVRPAGAIAAKAKRRARVTLGRARVSVPAGATRTVVLHLGAKARRIVTHLRRVAVVVTVEVNGGTAVTRRTSLRA